MLETQGNRWTTASSTISRNRWKISEISRSKDLDLIAVDDTPALSVFWRYFL